MKTLQLQEKILAHNNHYLLATNCEGNILYQEHYQPNALGKSEIREILEIINSGSFTAYIIKVNNGSILPHDDKSWVEQFNLMRLYRKGISRVAYVSPQNIFNSLEIEKEFAPEQIFRIRIFKKMTDAILWLEKTAQLS